MSHGKNIPCQRICAHKQRNDHISATHGREDGIHDPAHRAGSQKREDSQNPHSSTRRGLSRLIRLEDGFEPH